MDSCIPAKVNSSLPFHINAIIPYLCTVTDDILTVDPTVDLEVQPSKLNSSFINGRTMGLFTKRSINKGTIIMKLEKESMINDGIVDLTDILTAETSGATYNAWNNLKNSYYDIEKISRIVNVRIILDCNNVSYYETIQDIHAGAELLRMYGFTTWPLELLDTLTNRNIAGFIRFINELVDEVTGDPYEDRIRKLHEVLTCV